MANFSELEYLTDYGFTQSNEWLMNGLPAKSTMIKKGTIYDTQVFIEDNNGGKDYIVLFFKKRNDEYSLIKLAPIKI